MKIKIDSAGIGEVLNSAQVAGALDSLASSVAANVPRHTLRSGDTVAAEVSSYTASGGRLRGSRPGRSVALAHAAGMGVEAKHGYLVRAASAAGLSVKRRA